LQKWKAAFAPKSLGAMVVSMIVAGWIFYDSSKHWFQTMADFGFKNTLSGANFLAVAKQDPKNAERVCVC
jgi:hypothetical protein